MRRLVRENAVCVLAAAGASAVMAWLGLYAFTWTDYETEAQPSFSALTHGHVLEFLRLAPSYGGSLVERAPFALLPGLWGGGNSPCTERSPCPACWPSPRSQCGCARACAVPDARLCGARSCWVSAWPTR